MVVDSCQRTGCSLVQVRMTVVLDHVLDTVQHLLKKKVALERAVDPDTPDIIADGSRIVQVCLDLTLIRVLLCCIKLSTFNKLQT